MDPDMAEALVDELSRLHPDRGWSIRQATIVHVESAPILEILYTDSRHPDLALGAWWDFQHYEEYIAEPSYAACYAGIWLDEVFETVAISDFTEDDHGVRWAMMDSPTSQDVGRLPPHRARG